MGDYVRLGQYKEHLKSKECKCGIGREVAYSAGYRANAEETWLCLYELSLKLSRRCGNESFG